MNETPLAQVLIVDDDERYLRMMERILEERYLCTVASGPVRARELLASHSFSLLVCDVVMPGETGVQLLNHVVCEYPDLAALMVSGYRDSAVVDQIRALPTKACGYLLKPFSPAEFEIAVENLLCCRMARISQQSEHEREELKHESREGIVGYLEQIAGAGTWEWDARADELTCSGGLYRVMGTSPEETTISSHGDLLQLVHPDDREHLSQAIARAREEKAPFRFIFRIVRADGATRTIESQGGVVLDDKGDVSGMFGVGHDVTERRG